MQKQKKFHFSLLGTSLLLFSACQSAGLPLSTFAPKQVAPARVQAKWVLKQQSAFVPGEVVVQYRSLQSQTARQMFPMAGVTHNQELIVQGQRFGLLHFKSAGQTEAAMAELRQRPDVASVALNPRYTALALPSRPLQRFSTATQPLNDALYPLQWALPKIGVPQAWQFVKNPAELIVAVVDSGVDYNHPDLKGQIINGKDYMAEEATGPNGEGSPDVVDDDPRDQLGHGTHVAGIIAALADNQMGVSGIAPMVKVLNIKALNQEGWGSAFAIAQGITAAADQGARIINLSLGGGEPSKPIELAVKYAQSKGALIVAAAGNSFTHTGFPANLPGVLAVGATDSEDWLADFTNHDKRIDVMAPGVDIMSTTPTFMTNAMMQNKIDLFYSAMSGTSMACPMVSAQAALLLSVNPTLNAEQLKDLIRRTARPVGDSRLFGAGRIQIEASLQALVNAAPPVSPPAAPADPAAPPAPSVAAQRVIRR
ncbi:MAG: S8 family serine peptidase [Candidatus Sericytochromatia bacterium]